MMQRIRINFSAVALVVLPLVFAAFILSISSFRMLDDIAKSVNSQEHLRSSQAAQSALYSLQTSLEGIATDNAHWDDAATLAYEPLNYAWLEQTWGVGTTDTNYDTIFVLNPQGKTLYGYRLGKKLDLPAIDYLGPSVNLAIGALPNDNMTFDTISSFAQTPNGLAVFAASPILPYSEGKKKRLQDLIILWL